MSAGAIITGLTVLSSFSAGRALRFQPRCADAGAKAPHGVATNRAKVVRFAANVLTVIDPTKATCATLVRQTLSSGQKGARRDAGPDETDAALRCL
jgi:hypothetical protein